MALRAPEVSPSVCMPTQHGVQHHALRCGASGVWTAFPQTGALCVVPVHPGVWAMSRLNLLALFGTALMPRNDGVAMPTGNRTI